MNGLTRLCARQLRRSASAASPSWQRLASGDAAPQEPAAAAPAAAPAAPEGPPRGPVPPAEAGFPFIRDLTDRGADPNYFRNAHLSDRVKEEIYEAHMADPRTNSAAVLAEKYKVRQQRILAIVTLKKIERQREASGGPLAPQLAAALERYSGVCDIGTGERFVASVPTYPSYAIVPDDLPAERMPVAGGLLGDTSAAIEAEMVAEFTENLRRHSAMMGLDGPGAPGAGLTLKSRVTKAPSRPAQGWSLVVKPLDQSVGKGAGGVSARDARARAASFVALPGGGRRELNADEAELLKSQRVRPRRRLE